MYITIVHLVHPIMLCMDGGEREGWDLSVGSAICLASLEHFGGGGGVKSFVQGPSRDVTVLPSTWFEPATS